MKLWRWLSGLVEPIPYPDPPPVSEGFEAFLQWQADNPNMLIGVRCVAAEILARKARERAEEAKLRRIVHEEVAALLLPTVPPNRVIREGDKEPTS